MTRKHWLRIVLVLLCALSVMPIAFAAETPTSEKGIVVVDPLKAKSLMDGGVPVFDVRVANEYVEAHIKGAKNIPYKEKSDKVREFNASLDSFDLTKLPEDKTAPLIFYCNGVECWKSYKASVTSVRAGYKKIFWLRTGIPDWKSKGLPIE
ncbi:MAG: rhodanese-like domain-containing protein [Candidatus Korobacteraceae bacterium]